MSAQAEERIAEVTPERLCAEASTRKQKNDWEGIAALAVHLPPKWAAEWAAAAGEIAFALGQLGRLEEARDLNARAFELDPSHRLASALAYVHYDALMRHKVRKPRLDEPEVWRQGFERWIAEALRLRPDSINDRYRLGIYHASIQSAKDVLALKCFGEVMRLFDALPEGERGEGGRYWKTYIRTLYAAARSAFRLGRLDDARAWIFRCIRLDRERNHQEALFKYFLAGKVLAAQGQLDDAERGLRLALEHAGRRDHDFVYALLAEIALRRERVGDAVHWIELHIPVHQRKSYVWRILGDCETARANRKVALKRYKTALLKDHGGRHITLLRIGRLEEQAGRWREARQAYEQAAQFRRRRYLSEDVDALEALARLCERQKDLAGARAAYEHMARLPALQKKAERELARLAG